MKRWTVLALLSLMGCDTARGEEKKVTVRPFYQVPFFGVAYGPSERLKAKETLEYTPPSEAMELRSNIPGFGGLGVSFGGLSLLYSKAVTFDPEHPKSIQYGISTAENYQMFMHSNWASLEVYQQEVKGFFVRNPETFYPEWTEDLPNPQFPQHKLRTLGATATFVFSPDDFSIRAFLDQSENQKKSGGSFLGQLATSNATISNPTPVIVASEAEKYEELARTREIHTAEAGWSLGYAHTWIGDSHWYITFGALAGANKFASKFVGDDLTSIENRSTGGNSALLVGLGYSGETFFVGWSWQMRSYYVEAGNLRIDVDKETHNTGIGMRL